MDWFRSYNKDASDARLGFVAAELGVSYMTALGYYTALQMLANASPVRGTFLLTTSIPYPIQTVSETFHVTVDETKLVLQAFTKAELIATDDNGVDYLTEWDERQFSSDSSTNRVKKHREKKKIETLPERFGNAPETDTETEGREGNGVPPPTPIPGVPDELIHNPIVVEYKRQFRNGGNIPPHDLKTAVDKYSALIAHPEYVVFSEKPDMIAAAVSWYMSERVKPDKGKNASLTHCLSCIKGYLDDQLEAMEVAS